MAEARPLFSSVHALAPVVLSARSAASRYAPNANPNSAFTEVTSSTRAGSYFAGGPGARPSDDTAEDVVVVQFGSRVLRIGRAKDAAPAEVPHVVVHRSYGPAADTAGDLPLVPALDIGEDDLAAQCAALHKSYGRRRPPPNHYSGVVAHNRGSEPYVVPALNDADVPERAEFPARGGGTPQRLTGAPALRSHGTECTPPRWPIRRGRFNSRQYASARAVVDDMAAIWEDALVRLGLNAAERASSGLVVVVPQTLGSGETQMIVDMALRVLGFGRATAVCEAVAATIGAGVSGALLVDIGAQKSMACVVEDGSVVGGTLSVVSAGGDDLTMAMHAILSEHRGACVSLADPLRSQLDWEMAEGVRERVCTLHSDDGLSGPVDAEASLRRFNEATRILSFRVFDERLLVPLMLFDDDSLLLEQAARDDALSGSVAVPTVDVYYVPGVSVGDDETPPAAVVEGGEANAAIGDSSASTESKKICTYPLCGAVFETVESAVDHALGAHASATCALCDLVFSDDEMARMHAADHAVTFPQAPVVAEEPSDVFQSAAKKTRRTAEGRKVVLTSSAEAVPEPLVKEDELATPGIESALRKALAPLEGDRLRRAAASVLLVGGTSRTPGTSAHVAALLQEIIAERPAPPSADGTPDAAPVVLDFVLGARDAGGALLMDGAAVAWKGGAVYARLESTGAVGWISARQHDLWGARALRDRLFYVPGAVSVAEAVST